ncbi:hypothetical protein [Dermacoccus sp. Ellin185]|uniref:hypothetical protein n=1 Tax=Dermacoccus sp. Ellin185 TaxID=188626 RepID=UPI0001E63C11|nr:hypothetical protein [Dermacoccus sp. Ellin185]EFP58828.1 hypothetical protein HMPREF0321_1563 [Dermacoccus sp. Ellin185]
MSEHGSSTSMERWLGIEGGSRPMGRPEWLRVLAALALGLVAFVAVILVARSLLPDSVLDDAFGAWLPPILGGVGMGLASPAINHLVGVPVAGRADEARRGDEVRR